MVTKEKIDEAASIIDGHMGPGLFNYDGNISVLHVKASSFILHF